MIEIRRQYLKSMQSKINLKPDQMKVSYPSSQLELINQHRKVYKMDLGYFVPSISYHLPLAKISYEWGVAQLLFKFKLKVLLNVLMLMLLEHSVLVIGDSYEEVSSCTFALLDLLSPYQWVSVFIPLLPESMMEFISAPVPYVIGLCARDKAHLTQIENDSVVKEQIKHGLNVINLASGQIKWTQENTIKKKKLTRSSGIM